MKHATNRNSRIAAGTLALALVATPAALTLPASAAETAATSTAVQAVTALAASTDSVAYTSSFTFSDSGIEAEGTEGYKISGTELTINAPGTYHITGSAAEGSIKVKKGTTGVTLVLEDLTLASSTTAPLAINKDNGDTTVRIEGSVSLTDKEDPANEDSADEAVADAFEGAAIKVKSGSNLTLTGSGTLTADGSATKNAIKGGVGVTITVGTGADSLTVNAKAANNGIASDHAVVINSGTVNVQATGDAIKAEPDEDDTTSAGSVSVTGGTLNLTAGDDAIQSTADTAITGGTFTINSEDDAIHSEANVTITGGSFEISAGDDAVHAEAAAIIGTKGGADSDLTLNVTKSYEGIEGLSVDIYSGTVNVTSSDDGINAAGGSSSGSAAGPGGQMGGAPGGKMGGFGGQTSSGSDQIGQASGSATQADMHIAIYGGKVRVNATNGDGLDSNGTIELLGGDVVVFSQASGADNSPFDAEGSVTIDGATVFAAGGAGMEGNRGFAGSGQYYLLSTVQRSAGSTVTVSKDGTAVRSETLPRNANWVLYSSPEMTASGYSTNGSSSAANSGNTGGNQQAQQNQGQQGQQGQQAQQNQGQQGQQGQQAQQNQGQQGQQGQQAQQNQVQPGQMQPGQQGWPPFAQGGQMQGGQMGLPPFGQPGQMQPGQQGQQTPQGQAGQPQPQQQGQTGSFKDVTTAYAFYEDVEWLAKSGIAKGWQDGTFRPNEAVTRAAFAAFLYRMAGSPSYTAPQASPFADVSTSDQFYKEICWLAEQGITTGWSDGTFRPQQSITRDAIAAFLYRAAGSPSYEASKGFTDTAGSEHAEAIGWLAAKGISTGWADGTFRPGATTDRGATAAFLHRYAAQGLTVGSK